MLDEAGDPETADLLRKHGGKTGEELKAEGMDHSAGTAVFSSVELVDWMLGFKRPRTTE